MKANKPHAVNPAVLFQFEYYWRRGRKGGLGRMTRLALFILALVFLTSCSRTQQRSDIPEAAQRAMSKLRVGMKDTEAVSLMRPVSIDSGRMYWGGSSASRLYFQVSSTQQFWLESGGSGSDWTVTQMGIPEPKTKWTRHGTESITVE